MTQEQIDLAETNKKAGDLKLEMFEVMKMLMDADESSLPSYGHRHGHAKALETTFNTYAGKIQALWKKFLRKYPD